MKKITTPSGVFGPYESVEIMEDRYRVDGPSDLPFTVVGIGEVSDVQPGDFPPKPIVPPSGPQVQKQNKQQAESLLQATDWTATVDISNPQYSNPYLINQDEFLAYRSQVRAIAVNPPLTQAEFPPVPTEQWSS